MGIVQRQTIKFSIVSYVGLLVGGVASLFIYSNPIVKDGYGLQQYLLQAANTIFPLAAIGGNLVSVRFFPAYKDESNNHNGFLGFLLAICTIGLFVLGLIGLCVWPWVQDYFSQKENPLFGTYISYIIPLSILYTYCYLLYNYVMNFHRIAFSAFFLDFGVKVTTAGLMWAFLKGWIGLTVVLQAFVAYFLGVFLLHIVYIYKINQLHLKFSWTTFLPRLKGDMGRYMLFGAFGGLGYIMAMQGGSLLMLGSLTANPSKTSTFAIAVFLATVIDIPAKGLISANVAKISEYWESDNMIEMQHLYQRVSSNVLIPGLFIFLAIWVSIDSFFNLLPNKEVFVDGKYVFFILALGKMTELAAGMNNHIINYSRYFYWTFLAMVTLGLVNIFLNVKLIPIYDINGAAATTAICLCLYNFINILVVKLKFGLWPFSKNTIRIFLVGLFSYCIAYFIPELQNDFLNIFIHSGVFTVIYIGLVLRLNLSQDLSRLINELYGKVKNWR